jgi:hypothetical protein
MNGDKMGESWSKFLTFPLPPLKIWGVYPADFCVNSFGTLNQFFWKDCEINFYQWKCVIITSNMKMLWNSFYIW